jgi:hypothetical protein
VRSRVRFVGLVQAILSREGFRVPTGSSRCFTSRVEGLALPEHLVVEVAPLVSILGPLTEQIRLLDDELGRIARRDARRDVRVRRLETMPEIGPVTAVSFVATLDEVGRFRGAPQGGGLPGIGATGVELERGGEATTDHQDRERDDALAPGGVGVARGHAQEEARTTGAAMKKGRSHPPAKRRVPRCGLRIPAGRAGLPDSSRCVSCRVDLDRIRPAPRSSLRWTACGRWQRGSCGRRP